MIPTPKSDTGFTAICNHYIIIPTYRLDNSANNKRIAKNAMVLYVRMLFSLCINLYTSRVVLEVLGVKDFGIYNIVGGVVAMMGFLNSTMIGATSRFLTFDMGQSDYDRLQKTFNSATQIHIAIAIIILILGETIGLWFINNQLTIPMERIYAANWVYQFSLVIMVFTVLQVPFSATIIAHEKMNVYAYIEITKILLQLCAVLILIKIAFDKLIAYSVMLMIIAALVLLCYGVYCLKQYRECVLSKKIHWSVLKPILKFSGFDLFGNISVTIGYQGRNILINQFFGVVLNAASGVALQVSGAVSLFTNNIVMAFRPQIIKEYSSGNYEHMQNLMTMACRICLILLGLVVTPLYLNIEYIMHIWLSLVPDYAVDFCKIVILCNVVGLINSIIVIGIHATGRIKLLSVLGGVSFLSIIPISYVGFSYGLNADFVYWVSLGQIIVTLIVDTIILQLQISQISMLRMVRNIMIPILICVGAFGISMIITMYISSNVVRLFSIIGVNTIIILLLSASLMKEVRIKHIICKIGQTICQK